MSPTSFLIRVRLYYIHTSVHCSTCSQLADANCQDQISVMWSDILIVRALLQDTWQWCWQYCLPTLIVIATHVYILAILTQVHLAGITPFIMLSWRGPVATVQKLQGPPLRAVLNVTKWTHWRIDTCHATRINTHKFRIHPLCRVSQSTNTNPNLSPDLTWPYDLIG